MSHQGTTQSHLSENEFSSPGRLDAISTSYAYAMTQVMGKVDANLCRTTFAIGYQIQCWLGVISPEQAGCSWLTKSAFPMTGPWSSGWDSPLFLVIMIGSKSWASWSHPTWEDVAVLQATIVGQARVLWTPAYVSQPGHEIKLGDKGSTQLLAFSAHVLLRSYERIISPIVLTIEEHLAHNITCTVRRGLHLCLRGYAWCISHFCVVDGQVRLTLIP